MPTTTNKLSDLNPFIPPAPMEDTISSNIVEDEGELNTVMNNAGINSKEKPQDIQTVNLTNNASTLGQVNSMLMKKQLQPITARYSNMKQSAYEANRGSMMAKLSGAADIAQLAEGQEKIDVAPPFDKITGADFATLRENKTGQQAETKDVKKEVYTEVRDKEGNIRKRKLKQDNKKVLKSKHKKGETKLTANL